MDKAMADDVRNRIAYEGARTEPPPSWPALPDIPLDRYTSDEFFRSELGMFKRQWLLVGHISEYPDAGSYRLLDLPFAPVVVVRGKDGELRSFLNACRHRGAPVVHDAQGKAKYFVCSFHSWAYALDGTLVNVTHRRDFAEAVLEDRGLTPVRCETWGGMVFINLDPDAVPLADFIRPLADRFSEFTDAPLRVVRRQTREIRANWKVIVEAFLESYHAETVHPQTVNQLLQSKGAVMMTYEHGHSSMYVPYYRPDAQGESFNFLQPLPTIDGVDEWHSEGNVSNGVFPNVILPLEAAGYPAMIFWPITKDRTLYEEYWFGVDWGDEERPVGWDMRLLGWDVTVEEDIFNLEPMQVAIEATAHKGIPINYQERRIWHFHHAIDKAIGPEHIAPELRIPDLLNGFVESPVQQPVGTP